MTVAAPTAPVTPLDILRSAGVDIEEKLTGVAAVREARDKVGPVGPSLWVATLGEVTQATLGFLRSADLGEVMLTGWEKYGELRNAGARTRGTSDTVIVDLAGRNLVLRQRPRVELSLGGQPVATFQFVVSVDVRVRALAAVVKGGALVELTTGECLGVVSLELNGEQLASEECLLDPHIAVRLGNGVPLVGPDDDTSGGGDANPGGGRT